MDVQFISLLERNNELLEHIYALNLFSAGVIGAVFVCFILYKFIRLFY